MSTKTAGGLVAGAAGHSGESQMKIKLLRGKVVNGKTHNAGDVVETNDKDARHLITTKAAIEMTGGAKKADNDK